MKSVGSALSGAARSVNPHGQLVTTARNAAEHEAPAVCETQFLSILPLCLRGGSRYIQGEAAQWARPMLSRWTTDFGQAPPACRGQMTATRHILVVEDEEHLAIGLKYNLEAEGFRVTAVGDGPSALQVFDDPAGGIDLVILDLMLPGMSGYAVCERIRSTDSDVPVLILSARTLSEDRTRGFDVGADQYMMKPFDLDELISRVKNLLAAYSRRMEGAAAAKPSISKFTFAGATIDFDNYEVEVDGQAQRLTQLEMKLLQYFIEHAGRVIPRGELLENVWGLPAKTNTRAPDQFIRRLRKVFEPAPAKPCHFLTIRDVGYRFVASGEKE